MVHGGGGGGSDDDDDDDEEEEEEEEEEVKSLLKLTQVRLMLPAGTEPLPQPVSTT